ncbi:unnamed protein product [Aphanomyces euteiches]|uniref:Fe/B12 periplasmic-binding domain-containing protein n=1 Tax=Aphanomyces euteiches TaxID=100861 RepID=A0A6G0XQI0_9STRA|nr:hypothetical protein Ae201684_002633 [Aphanomyces euteiches]KAH9092522.1 hypothetical protein Ae201684P_008197 [Aphanomyces euteiches]KAH9151589.1 hypothetical protein AeRB84_005829 [Aphanomyces euteiches]
MESTMACKVPTIVVSGVSSGVGKTTIAVGIMSALAQRGLRVQSFKVGPDYLDSMHHTAACGGIPSVNLDGYMMGRQVVIESFVRNCQASRADVAVVEGCMGLFDGQNGHSDCGSTAEIAKWLGAPVVLVVDAWCLSRSAAAMVHGYASFDPDLHLSGVVFNKIGGDSHAQWLKDAIASTTLTSSIQVLGCVPKNNTIALPERHLGLHMPSEHHAAASSTLRSFIEAHIDLDHLLRDAHAAAQHHMVPFPRLAPTQELSPVRLGVARDEAFCFYYHDNLHLLELAGATLVYFSPIHDTALPANLHGLYFGGGYPELHAAALENNQTMWQAVRSFSEAGGLVYAECGGLMYLAQKLHHEDLSYSMVGVLPFDTSMSPRMTMGYCEATPSNAMSDLLRLPPGLTLKCHQFHFSEATSQGTPIEMLDDSGHGRGWKGVIHQAFDVTMERPGERRSAPEGIVVGATIASYCHVHFGATPTLPRALIQAARRRMRIASFEPSATETLGAIWATKLPEESHKPLTKMLQGVSEFCDFPPWLVDSRPRLSRSLITATTSEAIEAQVQVFHAEGIRELHTIDTQVLATAQPDVVFTQDACDRCSVTDSALLRALDNAKLHATRTVLCRPITIADILNQVSLIADVVGESARGARLRESLEARLAAVEAQVANAPRPRIVGLESAFPLVASGMWLPDIRLRAGGEEALPESSPGCAPRRLSWDVILASKPQVVVVTCCGKTATESADEIERHLANLPGFWDLPAVQNSHLYTVDHDVLSRPGPRVVDAVEIIAALLHPSLDILVHGQSTSVLQYRGPHGVQEGMARHFESVKLLVSTSPHETLSLPRDDVWTIHEEGPVPMAAHVLVSWKHSLLVVPGDGARPSDDDSSTIWQFDSQMWQPWTGCTAVYGEDVPTRRSNHAAAVWNDILLVFGGWDSQGLRPLGDLELLDLRTQCWTHGSTIGEPPCPRGNPTVVVDPQHARAFIYGGWNGQTRYGDIFRLDLKTWMWTQVVDQGSTRPSPRTDHSAVWWPLRQAMVVFGGTGNAPLNDVWLFDTTTESWEELECSGMVPSPRTSHAAVIHGNTMIMTGGQSHLGGTSVLNSSFALDLVSKTWIRLPQLNEPLCRHSMALLDGVVYAYGGYNGTNATKFFQSWAVASEKETCATIESTGASKTTSEAVSWAPTTPLTWADIEADEEFADEVDEINEVEDEEQPGERYRLLHRVACERGYRQYVDPASGYTVFTALFLKERPCCGYRCRHCPWGHKNVPKLGTSADKAAAALDW